METPLTSHHWMQANGFQSRSNSNLRLAKGAKSLPCCSLYCIPCSQHNIFQRKCGSIPLPPNVVAYLPKSCLAMGRKAQLLTPLTKKISRWKGPFFDPARPGFHRASRAIRRPKGGADAAGKLSGKRQARKQCTKLVVRWCEIGRE